MKIHRVVQMLGATTSTGKLADDMYDLGHKDYYSEAEDRVIPISHMDFQHLVRAFVKQNEETDNAFSRSMKLRNFLQEENEKLESIVEHNDRIYKKNLAELQDKYDNLKKKSEYDGLNVEGVRTVWQDRYEHELKNAEYWKDAFYKKDVIKGYI